MSTQVTVRGTSATHVMALTGADLKVSRAFPGSGFYGSIGRAYENEHVFPTGEFLAAAQWLLDEVRRQWAVLPYHYSFEVRTGGADGPKSRGSGGAGFRAGGRGHMIWGGAGRCCVEEWEVGSDGKGYVVRTTDVRDRKQIDTDDQGPIKLSRRKLDLSLPAQLESLTAFLTTLPDAEVGVRTTDGELSLKDLVRRAAKGDEGAEEELFNTGEPARQELLAMAADHKARKYHPGIAWVLLTAFPSPDSRAAVERMAEREADGDRKKGILSLLAASPR